MGSLRDQPVRKNFSVEVNVEIEFIKKLAKTHGISILEVVEILKYAELSRENNLYVANANIKDEQLIGFGELIEKLNSSLRDLIKSGK